MPCFKTIKWTLIITSVFLNNIKWMLTRYSTSLFAEIGVQVVTGEDFLKMQSKLILKVLTKQSIKRDQIFFFNTKGSTLAT